jgi:ketosteroid isomerase-like protein
VPQWRANRPGCLARGLSLLSVFAKKIFFGLSIEGNAERLAGEPRSTRRQETDMNTEPRQDETTIRLLHDAFEQAIKVKDLDRIMEQYATDVVAFDAVGALQFKGVEEYRAHWQRCFEFCQGEGFFESHELHVDIGGELACSRMLTHCGGSSAEGEMQSAWMRGTRVWSRRNGEWKVIHEHFSMPFDMQTGQVCMDQAPSSAHQQAG